MSEELKETCVNKELNDLYFSKYLITIDTLPEFLFRSLTKSFLSLPIPTEIVIEKPTFCVSKMGRAYETDFYLNTLDGGLILDYNQLQKFCLQKGIEFRGTMFYSKIYFVEQFSNVGDDGHIQYSLIGWRLQAEEDIKILGHREIPVKY